MFPLPNWAWSCIGRALRSASSKQAQFFPSRSRICQLPGVADKGGKLRCGARKEASSHTRTPNIPDLTRGPGVASLLIRLDRLDVQAHRRRWKDDRVTRSAWGHPSKVSMSHACLRINKKPSRISLDGPYDTAAYVEMQRQPTGLVPFVPLSNYFRIPGMRINCVSRTSHHVVPQRFTVVSNEHSRT